MDIFRLLIGLIFIALWLLGAGYIAFFGLKRYMKTKVHRKLARWKYEKLDSFALNYLSEHSWGHICHFSFIIVMLFGFAFIMGITASVVMGVVNILGL
jgi:hypothetical protein